MTMKSIFFGFGGFGLNTIRYLYSTHPPGMDCENISFFIWLQFAGLSTDPPFRSVPHNEITVLFWEKTKYTRIVGVFLTMLQI